jgi:hypothetical protein
MGRMHFSSFVALGASALMLLITSPVLAADLHGTVVQVSGKPVPGVSVIARNQAEQMLQKSISDANGAFTMTGLAPGTYQFVIDAGKSGFKGGAPVIEGVSDKGSNIKWVLSSTADPIVVAQNDITDPLAAGDPLGLTWPQFALIGGTIVGLGTSLGVAAAGGGFSGGSGSVASSSK